MATHSSILAWRIPETEEPGGLQSMGSQRVGHDWETEPFTFVMASSFSSWTILSWGFPCGSAGKESACNMGDLGSTPGLGRSPREGKGHPLQYLGLGKFTDCIVHGAAKSQTKLSYFHTHSILKPGGGAEQSQVPTRGKECIRGWGGPECSNPERSGRHVPRRRPGVENQT